MKKILIVSAVFYPEPVVSASISSDVALELSKNNHVTVICPIPSRPHGFIFDKLNDTKQYKIIRLKSYTHSGTNFIKRFRESYSFGIQCYKYISKNHHQIDNIYANSWPLFAQFYIVRAAKKFNIPITLHIQDIYPESLSTKFPNLDSIINFSLLPFDKYILNNVNNIIAISKRMKNYISNSRNINPDKIMVVQNWQDEQSFDNFNMLENKSVILKKEFTFMYLGNIGPVAGIDTIINAFVKANIENTRLIIAGSGSQKKNLEEKVITSGLHSIEFWNVPTGNVPKIQSEADILILPIKKGAASSSIPSKLPAYMFSKKPILAIVDKYSDSYNAIIDAKCGWVLDYDNIDKLSDNFRKLCFLDKTEIEELGINGYNYAISNYSKKKQLNKLINILNYNEL